MGKYVAPLLFGLIGCGVLIRLGLWQVERMHWKNGIIAQIEQVIISDPVALPAAPHEAQHQYVPVEVTGQITTDEITILASVKKVGPGYRIITAFVTDSGRRILLDRGFVVITAKDAVRPQNRARIIGNLHWPDEGGSAIPEPDLAASIWFERDVVAMAEQLNTEPVMVVQRFSSEESPVTSPFPVDASVLSNKHLEYVATWFGLALVWFGMTAYLIWRIRRTSPQ